MKPRVGITLQPDQRYLELLQSVFDDADYFEVAPETAWTRSEGADGWQPNGFYARFLDEGRRRQKPFVAHSVHGSLGTVAATDRARQQAWLQRVARDHEDFGFEWWTDHLGASVLGEHAVALPIALPMDVDMAAVVRERLLEMQRVVPDVGFENSAFYFLLGDWFDEPEFFDQILGESGAHLLLDLHNVYTIASNLGRDAFDYVQQIDLSHVIEIHVSGGAESPPEWLPNKRSLRLDSHDDAVPEPVWQLLERVVPHCANLRGVTLERMEGTVSADQAASVHAELHRIREIVGHV